MSNLPLGVVLAMLVFYALNSAILPSRTNNFSTIPDRAGTSAKAADLRPIDSATRRFGGPEIIINEVDSDTPGIDALEFVELYDGGIGNTPLDGLVLVFYNGGNDLSYASFDLDGFVTNSQGYFTLGNASVPGVDLVFAGNSLQNGQDAVALYLGNATNFPNGTSITTSGIVDALVYDNGQADDAALLVLLNTLQPQVNENGAASGATVSMQRCPNGSGGNRNTNTYSLFSPTPDGSNSCGMAQTDTIALSSAAFTEDESQTMSVTVTRIGTGIGTSSVQLFTDGGTATTGTCSSGADYDTRNVTVTFNGGENSATVNIPICSDQFNELSETFNVTLSNPVNAMLGSPSTAICRINEAASQFTNVSPIVLNGSGASNPFPSTINVIGSTNSISYMRVTLFDLAADAADDLDVLLVGPGGQTFVLMADVGGAGAIPNATTLTFNDNAASYLPDSTAIASGSYKPTSWENSSSGFPFPAPIGPHAEPGPGGLPAPRSAEINSVFGGSNANGTWSLYIFDDMAGPLSIVPGSVAGGWGIEMLAPTAAAVSLSGRVSDEFGRGVRGVLVVLEGGGLPEPRIALTSTFGYYSFEGLSSGTYGVTVVAKRYTFAVPNRTFNLTDSVWDADFIAEPIE